MSSETKTYEGSCHCGNVSYEVQMPELSTETVNACDCSICKRNGYFLVYVPRENVKWNSGLDSMQTYKFGPKRNHHKFCPTCGSSVLIDPDFFYKKFLPEGAPDILCLNVRMFKDVDLESLKFGTEGWQWKPEKATEKAVNRAEETQS